MAVKSSVFCILLLLVVASHAARRVDIQKRMSNLMSSPTMRRGADLPTEEQVLGLNTGEHLQEEDTVTTSAGNTKAKLQETYEGLPVVGESVVVEKDNHGLYTGVISGKVVEGINEDIEDVTPSLSVEDALQVSLNANGHKRTGVTFNPSTGVRLEIDMEETAVEGELTPQLVYRISYFVMSGNMPSRPITLVNAKSGALIRTWEGLTGMKHYRSKRNTITGIGGNEKMGKVIYGKDFPELEIHKEHDRCIFENTKVRIINLNNTWGDEINETFSFNCEEGFDDAVNGAYSPLSDILFYTTLVHDMFEEWYDMKPLKFKIVARVHCGVQYENAFWDGEQITFGDGNSTFYPLTNLDVTAHEIAHGVTEQHSDLIYYGEPGALNEAFSDMAGETAESFMRNKRAGDYKVGYEIGKSIDALRYMDDPPKDNRSIGHADDYCPGIDVHLSSGVFNRVYSILTRTEGWCARTTFGVFLLANRLYWTPSSSFSESACGTVQAAKDLGKNTDDVIAAFRAVGIEPCVPKLNSLAYMQSLKTMGEDINLIFDIPSNSNKLYVKYQQGARWRYSDNVTMTLSWIGEDSHVQSVSAEGLEMTLTRQANIASQYQVTLSTETNFTNGGLSVLTNGHVVHRFQNGTFINGTHYDAYIEETSVSFPESVITSGKPIALQLNYEAFVIIRHGQPVDLDNLDFDTYGFQTLFFCKPPKPGIYYVTLFSQGPMGDAVLTWSELHFPNPDLQTLEHKNHFGNEC